MIKSEREEQIGIRFKFQYRNNSDDIMDADIMIGPGWLIAGLLLLIFVWRGYRHSGGAK